jgi:hypothetical protein
MLLCSMLASAPVVAQQVEAGIHGGFTASEGIQASDQRLILGQEYDRLDVTSGGSWGATAGVFIGPKFEVEFLWDRQFSTLQISHPAPARTLAKLNVDNYHGNLVYNFGNPSSKVRPYVFGGVGATHYAPGDYDASIPDAGSLPKIEGDTRFSSTWGGGVKLYAGRHVGVKGTVRWTPTYIKSSASGLWCDPFFAACWVVGDPDYSHQLEISGGVTIRFGGH